MFDWVYVNAAFKQQKSYDEEGDPKPVFAIFEPYKGFMVKIILEVKYFEYVHYIMWKRKKNMKEKQKRRPKGIAANINYQITKLHLTNEKIEVS